MKSRLLGIILWGILFSSVKAQVTDVNPKNYPQLTGIPSLYIETFDGRGVTSKTTDKYCRLIRVSKEGLEFYDSVKIRGRGNSSWGFPKKPYRIKFPKREKFLGKGYAKAKKWVLNSNGGEKLMFRNGLISYVGELAGLPFNPGCQYVDMFLDGKCLGTYQITDKIDIRPHRVNIVEQDTVVTDPKTNITGGYLMEQDGYTTEGETYFNTTNNAHIRVHSPETDVINSEQINYIRGFLNKFESVLYSRNYLDKEKGYRQYIDSTTLLGWYLSSEIGTNFDIFHSTYFYKDRDDDHLYFGPLWDFDLGFNDDNRYGDETKTLMANVAYGVSNWFKRIQGDPWFRTACANHFNHMYENGLDSLMLHWIDSTLTYLRPSIDNNYKIWSIKQRTHQDLYLFDTYDEYVEDIKTFIVAHNAFLYKTFNDKKPTALEPDSNYYYRIYNKQYNDIAISLQDSTDDVNNVCIHPENMGEMAQLWEVEQTGSFYRFKNVRTKQYLTDDAAPNVSRSQIYAKEETETGNSQYWKLKSCDAGYFNFENRYSNRILTNYSSRRSYGNKICGYPSAEATDSVNGGRLWKIVAIPKSMYRVPDAIHKLESRIDYALGYDRGTQNLHFVAADRSTLVFRAQIYNLQGQIMGSFRGDEDYDASRLPAGTYIISWQFAGKPHSAKFLKSN